MEFPLSAALSARLRKRRRRSSGEFILDVSFELAAGITIVFGPSGAGKSTLLDCIAGLERPDEGRIAAAGEVLFDSAAKINLPPQKRRIAYVFQTLALFPHLTVEENTGYGLPGLPPEERRARVGEILDSFGVGGLRARKPGEISGGERQRVALARSLVTSPRLLLLDEPFSALDLERKGELFDDLRIWNAGRQVPILCVTHDRDEVDALGEHMIVLDHGRIVAEGLPRDVLRAPRRKRLALAAGFENLLHATVVELKESDGVMRVVLWDCDVELEVPLAQVLPGQGILLAIRAGDILLATVQPGGLSARNVLFGVIAEMGESGSIVHVAVDCGELFQVHVTPGAVRNLELQEGQPVWLVIKTHSCHFVAD